MEFYDSGSFLQLRSSTLPTMGRRSRKANFESSSESDDSEREGIADCGSDTDLTEPEDEADQPCNAGDASLLFADNEHSPEYYI